MSSESSVLETVLRRDRAVIAVALAALIALAWIHLVTGAGTGMSISAMSTWQFPPPVRLAVVGGAWDGAQWLVMLLMWWTMMVAMMMPSAAPMVLLYARVVRRAQQRGQMDATAVPVGAFVGGYLGVWFAFGFAATAAQWALERAGLIDGMTMWSMSRWLSAGLLMAAGLYQLSPLKAACLAHCRMPAEFLSRHWRNGRAGALRMGVVHGAYCLGCCWVLMALLFVGGAMNLIWIAGLSILVLAEKLLPLPPAAPRLIGVALILAGLFVLAR